MFEAALKKRIKKEEKEKRRENDGLSRRFPHG